MKQEISACEPWRRGRKRKGKGGGLQSKTYKTKLPAVCINVQHGKTRVDTATKSAVQSIPAAGKLYLPVADA